MENPVIPFYLKEMEDEHIISLKKERRWDSRILLNNQEEIIMKFKYTSVTIIIMLLGGFSLSYGSDS
ncbi:MAG: hypothetical protein QF856_07935, partial [Candidatus Marinimicrobia bacterium]|nr:hypothetical protein [Candidatus Neomarinimicrobiota bacterium]